MKKLELVDIDSDDIVDFLKKVESSFEISFLDSELENISTFGQLCELVKHKLPFEENFECTSQQAFYKLRKAISLALHIDTNAISPDSPLSEVFPRSNRLKRIHLVEEKLGFSLGLVEPPRWLILFFTLLILGSFLILFFHWKIALICFLAAYIGNWLTHKTSKNLRVETVGQLVLLLQKESYMKSRRNSGTVNKSEIENILISLFSDEFDLDKNKLTLDAKFIN